MTEEAEREAHIVRQIEAAAALLVRAAELAEAADLSPRIRARIQLAWEACDDLLPGPPP